MDAHTTILGICCVLAASQNKPHFSHSSIGPRPNLAEHGPNFVQLGNNLAQHSPDLRSTWGQLGSPWPNMGPTCARLEPNLNQLGPSLPLIGDKNWPILGVSAALSATSDLRKALQHQAASSEQATSRQQHAVKQTAVALPWLDQFMLRPSNKYIFFNRHS